MEGRNCLQPRKQQRSTRLARDITLQVPRERLQEAFTTQPSSDLFCDELSDVLWRPLDLVDELGASIDDGHEVFHVVMQEVTFAATQERFYLGCAEVHSVSYAYRPSIA
jgi:hypothetical protein